VACDQTPAESPSRAAGLRRWKGTLDGSRVATATPYPPRRRGARISLGSSVFWLIGFYGVELRAWFLAGPNGTRIRVSAQERHQLALAVIIPNFAFFEVLGFAALHHATRHYAWLNTPILLAAMVVVLGTPVALWMATKESAERFRTADPVAALMRERFAATERPDLIEEVGLSAIETRVAG